MKIASVASVKAKLIRVPMTVRRAKAMERKNSSWQSRILGVECLQCYIAFG